MRPPKMLPPTAARDGRGYTYPGFPPPTDEIPALAYWSISVV